MENKESEPEISVVIPAYNEEERIKPTLDSYNSYLEKTYSKYELIVVSDGSKDSTCKIVEEYAKNNDSIKLIDLVINQGKGFAVRTGMLAGEGRRLIFADADGASPIEELSRLEAAIEDGADMAIGSRAKSSEETAIKTALHRKIIGRVFNGLVNLLAVPQIEDTQCGFKLFKRDACRYIFSNQRSKGFSFDVELLMIAQRSGLTISEVPINWINIPGSKVNLILDSLRMFRDIIRFRFWHHNVSPENYSEFLESKK